LNKKEQLERIREVFLRIGTNAVIDFIESNDIQINEIELHAIVNDNSKVNWKSRSRFAKIFISELKKVMKNKKITIEMLGFLTYLIPYLDFENNVLLNEDGTYMTQNDIVKLTGWNRNKVNNTLKVLFENEIIYTKKQETDKRKLKYFINPNLFYKGRKIDKSVKDFYEQQDKLKIN
jgi:hypothetical protein